MRGGVRATSFPRPIHRMWNASQVGIKQINFVHCTLFVQPIQICNPYFRFFCPYFLIKINKSEG